MTDIELREAELGIRREQLALERARLFVDFAKYGFYGTLTAAIGGFLLILALACLSAWTSFRMDGWALVAMTLIMVVGATAFGFLSLWQAPSIAAKFGRDLEFAINSRANDNTKKTV
jgi:hypothetical protein